MEKHRRTEGLIKTLDTLEKTKGYGAIESITGLISDIAVSLAIMCDAVVDIRNSREPANGKHAHWIGSDDKYVPLHLDKNGCYFVDDWCKCSHCGSWLTASDEYYVEARYCPHCGALMDEKEQEEFTKDN